MGSWEDDLWWNDKLWSEGDMDEDNDENTVLDEELDDETLRGEHG